MSNSMSGTLTTDPSLEMIAYKDADPQYFPAGYNASEVPRVRFLFRSNDYPIPMEVEFDGDLAIEINENLKSGDRCKLNGIVHSGGDPIRPFGIDYERETPLSESFFNSLLSKLNLSHAEDHYEQILKLIENMAEAMEKDPSVFSEMNEGSLRRLLLMQLSGCYKGQATGETFNYKGKTDILINSEGKDIFIAECKFWNGRKSLTAAIDQLLGYTSRHYPKVAVIIFNRNAHFSKVLDSIKSVPKEHRNFKRELGQRSEVSFQFIFSHPKDPDREIMLTVMAFDVPK